MLKSDGHLWRRLWFADWSDEVEGRLHREVTQACDFPPGAMRDFHSAEILANEGRRLGWDDEDYLRWARRVEELEAA